MKESDELKISLIQSDIVWENKTANLEKYEKLLRPLSGKTDLVIFPETFTTGFSMQPADLAENNDGLTMQTVRLWSKKFDFAISGSFIAEENKNFFNRGFFITPAGDSYFYDKRHLFRMSEENEQFSRGNGLEVFSYKGWNLRMSICYDLRFPVWLRNQNLEYDLLICPANWPASRAFVWQTLLKGRAIENQCYMVGVNRIGVDNQGHKHQGDSCVIDYKGQILSEAKPDEESIVTAVISKKMLTDFRAKFPVWMDFDHFILEKE